MRDMYLVTGADWSHARSLLQFIASAQRADPATEIVVYDLGMTADQVAAVRLANPGGRLETFDYSRYPAYFDISVAAGEYAWKPTIIESEIERFNRPLCWMDAGTVIRKRLVQIRTTLWLKGFFAAPSGGTVPDWTHPGTFDFYGLPHTWGVDRTNLSASVVAFDPARAIPREVARKWAEGAKIKDCIAPAGSSRANHRQDQALLTILVYQAGLSPTKRWWRGREVFGNQDVLPEAELLATRVVPESMRSLLRPTTDS